MRQRLSTVMAVILIFAALASGIATYAALTETPPFGKDTDTILWLLNIDLIILLVLVSLVAQRMVGLWSGRRRGQAGSKLHVRLVFIFSLLAVTPAIIMTIFSAVFFHFGLQSWFSDKIHNAISQSEAFAEAYMTEHQQVIRADILAMANDLDRSAESLSENPKEFEQFLQTQSLLRNFSEAVIFDGAGRLLFSSGLALSMAFETLPTFAVEQADQGEVVMMTSAGDERIRALTKLNNFSDYYLFVGRMVDPMVRERLDATIKAVHDYDQLEAQRSSLQVKMVLIFVIVALLLLFAAIWFGLVLARQLASPITGLITAADRVRAGDLTARVSERDAIDEFEVLARAFNRMTVQIEDQREELITTNRQLDQRRRFTETVLAGVSSGVVGLDHAGKITLANTSAAALLQIETKDLLNINIKEIIPDLKLILEKTPQKPGRMTQAEIAYQPKDGTRRTLLVRIALELIGDQDTGAVLTFDDITELQMAQRKAAWSDVARRIAHEIKNPLTPIQLSAERLKRKYLKQIHDDPETFAQCTDTIIHHVGDIGRMVNEFSSFARMPDAIMRQENLTTIIREILVFQQQAHPEMSIGLSAGTRDAPAVLAQVDAQQVRQALTNVLQNAIDALEGQKVTGETGTIEITTLPDPEGYGIALAVTDNGPGFPQDVDTSRLTEPYVTHREKGTGLGLAIVKKIMDDHKGKIIMGAPDWLKSQPGWNNLGGATIVLVFPHDHADETQTGIPAHALAG
jgi:two-component system nitrogen regulation sensor histidine kinase NtrY